MEAKDTVLSLEEVAHIIFECEGTVKDARQEVNLAQAEVSFKAGKEERLTDSEIAEALDEARWAGYYSGTREVVEWFDERDCGELSPHSQYRLYRISEEDWQAKLKE